MTSQRLARLRSRVGFYGILALDHGLSVGAGAGAPQSMVDDLIRECAPHIGAVVLTYGLARPCTHTGNVPLILQCFGAPDGNQRVQVATVDEALRLDAAAVSVQVDLGHPELSDRIREICLVVASAHAFGMPVLFMVSGFETRNGTAAAHAIRTCQELGADLVKVSIAATQLDSPVAELRAVLVHGPPVLIAGGPHDTQVLQMAASARATGFAGYCIGRNIFEAEHPSGIAKCLYELFTSDGIDKGDNP